MAAELSDLGARGARRKFPIDEVGKVRLSFPPMEAELLANLEALASAYVSATGGKFAIATVAQRALGDWRFFERLKESDRASFTVRKYDAAVAWFDANWPETATWPADIARPAAQQGTAA
jgi:hypothetical protein